jgi:hypothetical protein
MSRVGVALAATALAGAVGAPPLQAAEQPMSIGFTIDRQAWIIEDAGQFEGDFVLQGTVSCTRSEPLDLFISIDQNGGEFGGNDGHIPCAGPDPQRWRYAFLTDAEEGSAIVAGDARVSITACTNPSEAIDEDCVTFARAVDVSAK